MTARLTKLCSTCGKRKSIKDFHRDKNMGGGRRSRCTQCDSDSQARHYADNCYEIRARRARIRATKRAQTAERNAVMLHYCPDDAELGVPMYTAPVCFQRSHFEDTLAEGYWPDGAIFEYALVFRGDKSRWRVSGQYIQEVGSERVALGDFGPGDHARVRLINVDGGERSVMG